MKEKIQRKTGICRILLLSCLAVFVMLGWGGSAECAEKIIFIPHDNRPISMQQTAEVVEQAGYELVLPPEELLSRGLEEPGNPGGLWKWLEENAKSARAAVVSTDSMLYGGLIPSRKHEISQVKIDERVKQFKKFHDRHPKLKLYLFGSLMRTPKSWLYSGNEEPGYYNDYGADIFRYTALKDKEELGHLSARENAEMKEARQRIPSGVLLDWMNRREKNLSATKQLMDLTKQGIAKCFVVGRDDNAPFCQTHKENRELKSYAATRGMAGSQFKSLTGIDEFNLLLLTRAVNDLRNEVPFVHVLYNEGTGADTVPSYSDEHIGDSIRDSIVVAGGMLVPEPGKADFVLLVNTDPQGRTGEASFSVPGSAPMVNDGNVRDGSMYFFKLLKDCLAKGYPVGIADIAFANGSDNALMENLRKEGLLGRLRAYSGWNTATNSSGFALGIGMLSNRMTDAGRERLLLRRCLDDWAYQANVRGAVENELQTAGHGEAYGQLDGFRTEEEDHVGALLRKFAERNFPSFDGWQDLKVSFPWNRMFECKIMF
ncbi:MAG: DUF4127 family protein [Selenomonadaceae bacterium]|nr:DUF4127 family protein [Selenomonadaceae bacterium]